MSKRPLARLGFSGAAVAAIASALAAFLGGCVNPKVTEITDPKEVAREIRTSPQPLMVDFYKGGCLACAALEDTYGKLAQEYDGKVVFIRHMLMAPTFMASSPELVQKYGVISYPTVILFVGGQERQRWIYDLNTNNYRPAINAAIGVGPRTPAMASGHRDGKS